MQRLKSDKDRYDAVIIGAGISGLVCGCYLAKAGMKVLIAEQHSKPGGYCTSFKRKGFTFDAAAHSFGGYRKNGIVRKVFDELGIERRLKVNRFDPSDIVITPDCKVSFWADLDSTIKEIQRAFPEETGNIDKFFSFILNPDPNSFSSIRSSTFKDVLDRFFINEKLKAVLSFPLFGDGGLPPSIMSAFIGSKIFKEYILDGGHYPEGGMQTLPDSLAERLKELGGELRLSTRVKRISVREDRASGVVLEEGKMLRARYVISNCDSRQTFLELLDEEVVKKQCIARINEMIPSLSLFILYLGIDRSFTSLPIGTNVWYLSSYDLERAYLAAKRADIRNLCGYMIRLSPNERTVSAYLNLSFKNKPFWDINKERILKSVIARIEKTLIPDFTRYILYKETATPQTLYRYTLNYKGAAYGWACTPWQLAEPDLRKPSFIRGLYLTGHWITQGLGIPGVVYTGYETAKALLRKEHIKHT